MNYLAHAYLSFNHPAILTGNMISDFVKGKKKFDYPPEIQKGITLHRTIDRFTDEHPSTQKGKEVFRPAYRLYSAAFIDVVFDHFLANDLREFSGESLKEFAAGVYSTLETNRDLLPETFSRIFPYMKSQDWLSNYQYVWGIQKSFGGLVRRAAYLTESETAFDIFKQHYDFLNECYTTFFSDLKSFTKNHFDTLLAEG